MKKLFLLGIMCFMALAMNAQSFVDLGLPSGTKWKTQNQSGFYTYDEAVAQFGNRLPTKDQWKELQIECSWEWTGNGYKVTGSNGNSIVLPADGGRSIDGNIYGVGSGGTYWSSMPNHSEKAWSFYFDSNGVYVSNKFRRNMGLSVRLVQR